jgi:hypothetical protein
MRLGDVHGNLREVLLAKIATLALQVVFDVADVDFLQVRRKGAWGISNGGGNLANCDVLEGDEVEDEVVLGKRALSIGGTAVVAWRLFSTLDPEFLAAIEVGRERLEEMWQRSNLCSGCEKVHCPRSPESPPPLTVRLWDAARHLRP